MPNPKRRRRDNPVQAYFPPELLADFDLMRASTNMSRSAWIVGKIEQDVAAWKKRQGLG